MAVALWVVRDVCNDLVPELFVEWPCLKAESRQEDSVAPLRPGFVFGSPEEFRSVSLPAERLRHPQGVEVEPPSPDVTKGPAEHRAPLVLEEDGERAVVGVPGDRHVEERQSIAHKCGVLRAAQGFRDDPRVCHDPLPVRLSRTRRVLPGLSCLFRYLLPLGGGPRRYLRARRSRLPLDAGPARRRGRAWRQTLQRCPSQSRARPGALAQCGWS